mgnify:CR=1 FL=1
MSEQATKEHAGESVLEKTLYCPECKSDKIRAKTNETCRVDFDEGGDVISAWDFDNDGVDEDTLYCEECGIDLSLVLDNETGVYSFEKKV